MGGKGLAGVFLLISITLGSFAPTQAEMLTIGGTGSSGPLIQILFDGFQQQAPELSLNLISPPLGSNGALEGLRTGRVDIAVVGRPISPDELMEFGQHFDLADTPFIFASLDGHRPEGFTLEELAEIYEGTVQEWDSGAPIRLLVRRPFESDTLLMNTMSPGLEKAVAEANSRPGMTDVVNDIEAVSLLAATPGSLGPTTLGLLSTLGTQLVVFPLEGVVPSIDTLRTGQYPWYKRLTVVFSQHPCSSASSFAIYLRSPEAQALMLRYDYLPVAP